MVTARMPYAPKSTYRHSGLFCENTAKFSCTPTPRANNDADTRRTTAENSSHDTGNHSFRS